MSLIAKKPPLTAIRGVMLALAFLAALLLSAGRTFAQRVNLAKFRSVSADSYPGTYDPIYAVGGVVGNDNGWVSGSTGPHWLQIDLPIPFQFGSAHLFSGWNDGSAIADFSLPIPISPLSGPATGSFNGLHWESNFLAIGNSSATRWNNGRGEAGGGLGCPPPSPAALNRLRSP